MTCYRVRFVTWQTGKRISIVYFKHIALSVESLMMMMIIIIINIIIILNLYIVW